MSAAIEAIRVGFDVIAHSRHRVHTSQVETKPAIKLSLEDYLYGAVERPYLADGSIPPEPGRTFREIKGTIDLSAIREI